MVDGFQQMLWAQEMFLLDHHLCQYRQSYLCLCRWKVQAQLEAPLVKEINRGPNKGTQSADLYNCEVLVQRKG